MEKKYKLHELWQKHEKEHFVFEVAFMLHQFIYKLKDFEERAEKLQLDVLTQRPMFYNPDTFSDAKTLIG